MIHINSVSSVYTELFGRNRPIRGASACFWTILKLNVTVKKIFHELSQIYVTYTVE